MIYIQRTHSRPFCSCTHQSQYSYSHYTAIILAIDYVAHKFVKYILYGFILIKYTWKYFHEFAISKDIYPYTHMQTYIHIHTRAHTHSKNEHTTK